MSSDYYPPKGPEWVAPEELRRDSKHTAALLAEKYSHDVMNFRSQFFAKLAAHGAIHAGYGWATFNSEGEESSLATVGIAEVLLFCRPAIQPSAAGDHVVPVIRIITNEPVVYSGEGIEDFSYLTEEVTVDDDDDAQYLMDAVRAHTFKTVSWFVVWPDGPPAGERRVHFDYRARPVIPAQFHSFVKHAGDFIT